jgi:hypothetical protein
MRPYCPRETLGRQTPQARSVEKTALACAWLATVGFSTQEMILSLLRIKARGICARLQRAGLLREVSVPMSSLKVWALTRDGLRTAEAALGRQVTYLANPERLNISRLTHEIAVQREAIARFELDLPALRSMRADRELRRLNAAARPDLIIRRENAAGHTSLTCFEVEISPKSSKDVRAKMLAILPLLGASSRTQWLWVIPSRATAERYARTWAEVVDEAGQGYALSADQLRQACRFELATGRAG